MGGTLASAEIHSGVCGFTTVVEATAVKRREVQISIQSGCPHIQMMAESLTVVDPYQEISCRQQVSSIISAGLKHCVHAACPVPVGMVKAVEVAAKLALPRDVVIHVFVSAVAYTGMPLTAGNCSARVNGSCYLRWRTLGRLSDSNLPQHEPAL